MIDEPIHPAHKPRFRYLHCTRGDAAVGAMLDMAAHARQCSECTVSLNPLTGEAVAVQRVGAERQIVVQANLRAVPPYALAVEHRCKADA
ncbi:MAG: hypothetical protein KIH64_006305 [Mycobacterium sp.]|nr:hypothetical protein [Mycobacterium sp.]